MSKLFEAISKIEKAANQGAIEVPFSKKNLPLTINNASNNLYKNKIFLFALCFFLIGITILITYNFYLSKFFENQIFHQENIITNKKLNTKHKEIHYTTQSHTDGKNANNIKTQKTLNKQTNTKIPQQKKQYNKITNKQNSNYSTEKRQKILLKQNNYTTKNIAITKTNKHYNTVTKTEKHINNPNILTYRQKKLLYRAEKLRKSGEKDGALIIYKKIWIEVKNPLIANNLAAILMEKRQYNEAKKILEKAISIKPNDPDLKYNLSIVKAYLKNKLSSK